jgi:aspartyl-tRNA(Asn)/glutamyl-tRNA(Gln) amidotransferase subunit A
VLDENLAFTPATELRDLIAAKAISPVELTELYLDRIERLDGTLNSYLTVAADSARETARLAEAAVLRGDKLGPLHGIPVSVKDLELTRGIRTTGGSLAFKDRVPEQDSLVVERLRQAGAIIVGKTNTPEFGLSGTTENRLGDACRNPWDPTRTSGGSSGGAAAALAAGLCAISTGTDGGGSIRIPASFCGVYGLKPTQGRIPRFPTPVPPIANHLSQPGPISRTVADAALLMSVLAGYDKRDPGSMRQPVPDYVATASGDIAGLRLGWSSDFGYAPVDPAVARVCEAAADRFRSLGCSVEEAELKLDDPFPAFWTLFASGSYAAFGSLLNGRADDLTDYGRVTLEQAAAMTAVDYTQALGYVDRLRAQFDDVFDRCDLLLSPTMAVTAFPIEERPSIIAGVPVEPFWGFLPFTFPINMIGHPAASIPCALIENGNSQKLPVGLHIIGRRGDEAAVLTASAAFEGTGAWGNPKPPIS